MSSYVELTYWQVGLAALLIVVNGAISVALRLQMERSLLIASIRTVVQLTLVGFVLEWVFQVERWYVVLALAALMTLIAGATATSRNDRRYPGIWINTIVSIWASSWLVMAFALFAVLRGIDNWYQPQYAIPLLGMVLGNTLNGISVGLNTFTESLVDRRDEVETLLALGATRWEAARNAVRHAVRIGMVPIINSMMIVGIVSLPGMMTGQLVSGMQPMDAVKYQIVIMFLIASATALGTVGVVLLSFRRLLSGESGSQPPRRLPKETRRPRHQPRRLRPPPHRRRLRARPRHRVSLLRLPSAARPAPTTHGADQHGTCSRQPTGVSGSGSPSPARGWCSASSTSPRPSAGAASIPSRPISSAASSKGRSHRWPFCGW